MFFRRDVDVMAPILQCFGQSKEGNQVTKSAFANQKNVGHVKTSVSATGSCVELGCYLSAPRAAVDRCDKIVSFFYVKISL